MERTLIARRLLAAVVACVYALLLACAIAPQPAHAASAKNVTLKKGKTYTKYDITGDGKADAIKITCNTNSDQNFDYIRVFINKDQAYISDYKCLNTSGKLMITSGGRAFLYLLLGSYDMYPDEPILTYKQGGLIKVLGTRDTANWFGSSVGAKIGGLRASGNKIVVTRTPVAAPSCGDSLVYSFSYAYKSGRLKRTSPVTSRIGVLVLNGSKAVKTRSVVANKTLQSYSNAKCTKKSSKLRYGDKLKVKKLYLTRKCRSLQVKTTSGKTCWLKIKKGWSYPSATMFQNAVPAGW